MSLSAVLFLFPFENSPVSSFIPDDRKGASGAMAKAEEAEVAAGVAATKTAASRFGLIVNIDRSVGSIVRVVVVHIAAFVF